MTAEHERRPGPRDILSAIVRAGGLPALPMVVLTVLRQMQRPDSAAADIARLLGHDQGLTARVLRLANSAFYSPREPITSIQHAVVVLGHSTLRKVVLRASVFSAFDADRNRPFWLHALGTACCARAVAKVCRLGRHEEAFVMGLLHDMGKLALAQADEERSAAARDLVARSGCLLREAEQQVFGFDHADVGDELCRAWSLPEDIRVAIACHHRPEEADQAHQRWAACVHVADILARAMLIGNGGDQGIPVLHKAAQEILRLPARRLGELFPAAERELDSAEVFFSAFT